ncbi:G-PROTEIN-RECEP-F1-2 domain-containing protein [Aphelenchoides besseyi]|nr:G-PROTEIN-RECEP-F1-2 domain-containing protein [Aphelenchoides besseyi]
MSTLLTVEKERTFYSLYKEDPSVIQGPIYLAWVLLFVMCFGLIGNIGIVVLTYRNSRLKNSCNYLLALLCLSDCIHQFGHFSYIYRMFTGNYFLSLKSCFLLQMIPLIGTLFGAILPLIISIDRLLSCFFPRFHLALKPSVYGIFVFSISGLYIFVNFYAATKQISEHGDQLMLCAVPDPLLSQRPTNLIYQLSVGLMNTMAVSIYATVWIRLSSQKHQSDGSKRAFKALFAIIFSLLGSWVAGAIGQLILMSIDAGPQQFFYSLAITGVCINLVCAIVTIDMLFEVNL